VDFGKISLLLGNGDGTFQPYSLYLAGPPTSFSAADLNDDGAPDLVVSHLYGPSISIFFNRGTTSLGSGVLDGKKATLTLSTLTVGNHQIRAKYGGDSTFVPVRSKKLTQQVRP
jgi:hypothetical protein